MNKPKRGVTRVADLYANSSQSHGSRCWHWLGAKSVDGSPRIWTFDHDRGEKRTMAAAKAVWNIATGTGVGEKLAYRTCFCTDCVNPDHVRLASSKKEIGELLAKHGRHQTDRAMDARRKVIAEVHKKMGFKVVSPETVRFIRSSEMSGVAISKMTGISTQTISRIRCGVSHKSILEAA